MTYLLVTCKALGQSPLQPDQYRSSIKSPVLLYSSDYPKITIAITYNDYSRNTTPHNLQLRFIINERYYDLQLETALCYQHYFCNTEFRTARITKIKGLSIQTQQNTFVLFTLFKLTLDERKTLTKISTCKTSRKHSPNQRTLRMTNKQGENPPLTANNRLYRKEPFA